MVDLKDLPWVVMTVASKVVMWAGSKVQMKVVLLVQLKVVELVVTIAATTAEKKAGPKVVEKAARKDYWTAEMTDDLKESVMVELLGK